MAEPVPARLFLGQAPITTAAALFTAGERTVVTNIHVANVTGSAAFGTLYLVPKGGSVSAANQITGGVAATGQSFSSGTTEVLAASAMGGIVLNPGDAIYGLAVTGAANLTFAISGVVYGEA